MDDKLFGLIEKMYSEMQQGFKDLRDDQKDIRAEIQEMKSDIKQLGAKIDGEITDKLKALSEEQSIMRKDIQDIKELQSIHDTKIDDLTMAVNNLSHNQKDQEREIWELRKVK